MEGGREKERERKRESCLFGITSSKIPVKGGKAEEKRETLLMREDTFI